MAYFILQDRKVVEAAYDDWSEWRKENNFVVGKTEFPSGIFVSTVFIGCSDGELFETMVFPSPHGLSEIYCARYDTYGAAVRGHLLAVKKYWED